MSDYITASLRQLVRQRAAGACEYCKLHETFAMYSHEIDHVIALKHGGKTTLENLVLACMPCNRHKGSDLTTFDPITGQTAVLFNPRTQNWTQHFRVEGVLILGLTATGRATVFLLKMNESSRLPLRQSLVSQGLYPDLPPMVP